MRPKTLLERAYDALEGAYAEFDAMMETYEDYVPTGRLLDEIEKVMDDLEKALQEKTK